MTLKPYRFDDETDRKKHSAKSERRLAKAVGGRTQPGSGAFDTHKGDVINDDFLFEHKETGNASRSITVAEMEKIKTEALQAGRMPAFVLEFLKKKKKYVVLDFQDFLELTGIDE